MLVVTCHLKPRPEFYAAIHEQSWKANQYRNKLMELYLGKIRRYRELRFESFPELRELFVKCDELKKRLEAERLELSKVLRAERDGHPKTQEVKAIRSELKAARDALSSALKAQEKQALAPANAEFKRRFGELSDKSPHGKAKGRKAILAQMFVEDWPEFWKEVQKLDAQYLEACKLARKDCGLAVGTYLAVEDAHSRAVSDSDTDPSFKKFRGDGKLGHQCNKGKLTPKMVQFSPYPDERAFDKNWQTVRFNIGKVSKPIWIEGRCNTARLRQDVPIKWVYLQVRREGLYYRYELQFTLDTEREHVHGTGTCAVNVGWRRLDNGNVRVGYCVDDSNNAFEIVIPSRVIEKERRCSHIEGVTKRLFLQTRDYLSKELRKSFPCKPEWLDDQIQHMHLWHAHGRLARVSQMWYSQGYADHIEQLWQLWKSERLECLDLFEDPEDAVLWATLKGSPVPLLFALEMWRRKDAHLVNGALRGKIKAQRVRREIYRVAASQLAKKYATVIVGPYKLDKLIKKPEIEDDRRTAHDENASSLRQIASPGLLRDILIGHKNAEEGIIEDITVEHFGCGGKTKSDPKKQIHCECSACGQTYDQDRNAAQHLLQRARERLSLGLPPGRDSRSSLAAE